MRFAIAGKVYDAATLEDVRLSDILLFEQQAKVFDPGMSWSQIGVWADELDAMSDDEKRVHPAAVWLTAVTVWASRRTAGETLSFGDAIDVKMSELSFLPEPQDHKKPANPRRARSSASTGTGRAARSTTRPEPADGETPTSELRSVGA